MLGADLVAHRCVLLEAEAEAARLRVSDADRARYFELAQSGYCDFTYSM